MIPPRPRNAFPKLERLKRSAVSIIAGFKTKEGIVLCADTQETIGTAKRNVSKLRLEPPGGLAAVKVILAGGDTDDIDRALAVAFCGSTDDATFMDMVIDEAWSSAGNAKSLQEACNRIAQSIRKVHREYVHLYQPGYMPRTDLIYGVKMAGGSRLFSASGPAIHEKDAYATGGAGFYMADFLAARTWEHGLNLRQCIILAAYILFEAKLHVDGCGGDSHIGVLRNHGTSGLVHWDKVEAITRLTERSDKASGGFILHAADLTYTRDEFLAVGKAVLDILADSRESEREHLERMSKMLQDIFQQPVHDEEGLPTYPKSLQERHKDFEKER